MTEPAVGASTCASGNHVCTGHIGTFTANDAKKASQSHIAGIQREVEGHERRNIGRARVEIRDEYCQQHQDGAEQRIEEELERRVYPARPAPNADNQEHRDQDRLEEDVERDEIERAEHADHHRFQHQEGDHIFLHPDMDGVPARANADRRQQGRQQHEEHGNPVHAHVVVDLVLRHPRRLLHKLESGVDVSKFTHNKDGGMKNVMPDVHSAHQRAFRATCSSSPRINKRIRIAPTSGRNVTILNQGISLAIDTYPAAPTAIYQVISATTPINMAKA